jgi:hypothetical protein
VCPGRLHDLGTQHGPGQTPTLAWRIRTDAAAIAAGQAVHRSPSPAAVVFARRLINEGASRGFPANADGRRGGDDDLALENVRSWWKETCWLDRLRKRIVHRSDNVDLNVGKLPPEPPRVISPGEPNFNVPALPICQSNHRK